jgi:hypothetical protein
MAKYAVSNFVNGSDQRQNLTTTFKSQITVTAATGATTLRKAWIYDFSVGCDQTPADNAIGWCVDRQSSLGTGTTQVAPPLETTDAAALIVCTVCHTIEPIVTATTKLWEMGINQRAGYRWVAYPGGEFVVPATNVTGIGLRALSPAYTGKVNAALNLWE